MRVLTTHRQVSPRIVDDPRLSRSQLDAIKRLAEKDGDATLRGLDQKMRPVVSCKLDGPGRTTTALLRNGDPAKPVMPLAESWR